MTEPSASSVAAARADVHNLAPLLDAALAGDAQAMDALLIKLRPYFHSLLKANFGAEGASGLDHSALVQESLMRVFRHLGTLRGRTVPYLLAWAKTIVENLARDAKEKKEKEKREHEAERERGVSSSNASGGNDASAEIRERWMLRVREALHQLPERRRQVIEMSFFERVSDAEIGRRLCGSPGAVRVLRSRALKQLRELLEIPSESDHYSRDFSAWQPKQVDHEHQCGSGRLE